MTTDSWVSAVSAPWSTAGDWSGGTPTSKGTVTIAAPGSYDITIGSGQAVSIDSLTQFAAELTVNGDLTLDNPAATSTIGPGATLDSTSPGATDWTVYDQGTLINQGTLLDAGLTGLMEIYAASFGNAGVIAATNGGIMVIDAPQLGVISAGTLTGGTYEVLSGSTSQFTELELQSQAGTPTAITTDAATIILSGPWALLQTVPPGNNVNAVDLEATLASIAANGTLAVLAQRNYVAATTLTDAGMVILGGGSFSASGVTIAAGGTLVGFGTLAGGSTPVTVAPGAMLQAAGGTLDVSTGISNAGTVAIAPNASLLLAGVLQGTVIDAGTLIDQGGLLQIDGTIAGSGGVLIAPGNVGTASTLSLTGAGSETVTFGGDFAALRLGNPPGFSGTISGFGAGDTIDLAGITANGATLVGNLLDITNNGQVVESLAMAAPGTGLTVSAAPDGNGNTAITAGGTGITFNFIYDASVANAPAAFKQGLTIAAENLARIIQNPITVNIDIGFGELDGSSIGESSEGGPAGGTTIPYAQFVTDFAAAASSPAALTAAANLPSVDPTNGAGVYLSYAQEQAWGLLPATSTLVDGSAGFSSQWDFDYDSTNGSVPADEDDFIGDAEHELTHALGRAPGSFLDLFRYTAPGVFQTNETGSAYFSVDDGKTALATFDTTSDPSDWAQSNAPDSFGAYAMAGQVNPITAPDTMLLSALGFEVACFVGGTSIRTVRGNVAVEELLVGDRLPTRLGGSTGGIIWIGRRTLDCRAHPHPSQIWPVRVQAGAFGRHLPRRDLFLSPDHAVFVDQVLIPIRHLVNGGSIAQVACDQVTYWHIELDRHDIIQAEGLPCETYLDTGNRHAFEHGGPALALHPDFSADVWRTQGCARLHTEGPLLARVRQRLISRLDIFGCEITADPALTFQADHRALDARITDRCFSLALPPGAETLRILSRAARPADLDPDATDARTLGVAVHELRLDGQTLPLSHRRLRVGWHADECAFRWTNGAATLDVAGARRVEVRIDGGVRYLVRSEQVKKAAVA